MRRNKPPVIRVLGVALSTAYLAIWALAFAEALSLPLHPIGSVTLVLPALLGLVTVASLRVDEPDRATRLIGALAITTLASASWGIYAIFVVGSGLFVPAFLTLGSAGPLAGWVIVRGCFRGRRIQQRLQTWRA